MPVTGGCRPMAWGAEIYAGERMLFTEWIVTIG